MLILTLLLALYENTALIQMSRYWTLSQRVSSALDDLEDGTMSEAEVKDVLKDVANQLTSTRNTVALSSRLARDLGAKVNAELEKPSPNLVEAGKLLTNATSGLPSLDLATRGGKRRRGTTKRQRRRRQTRRR